LIMAPANPHVGQSGMFDLIVPGHLGRLSNSSFLFMLHEQFRFAKWPVITRNQENRGVLRTLAKRRKFLFPLLVPKLYLGTPSSRPLFLTMSRVSTIRLIPHMRRRFHLGRPDNEAIPPDRCLFLLGDLLDRMRRQAIRRDD